MLLHCAVQIPFMAVYACSRTYGGTRKDDLHPIKSDGAQQAVDNAAASEVQSGDANLQVQNNDVIVEVDGQPQTTTATKDIVIDARALTVAAVEPANAGIAPVATVEETDDDDDAAKVNESTKWSKCRVKLLKFNENKYFQYVVVAIVLIASVTLVKIHYKIFLIIIHPKSGGGSNEMKEKNNNKWKWGPHK